MGFRSEGRSDHLLGVEDLVEALGGEVAQRDAGLLERDALGVRLLATRAAFS
jgi:hypothetical protein